MGEADRAFALAVERYAEFGVDVEAALERMASIQLSLHCWQGDDVTGFEGAGALDGGIAVTGDHPGRARTPDELRADLDRVYALLPGTHRLNLHAIYAETDDRPVGRDALAPEHFARWLDWARAGEHGLDFNPTCFSHPRASDGWTLAHRDEGVRDFWVEHVRACRRIGAHFGRELGTPCVDNIWIPDGSKDLPVDRKGPRERLVRALDAALAEDFPAAELRDSVEAKLFGIGSEAYVAGSHEFYMGYALSRGILLCLDAGHFHPTEVISDKISAVFCFLDELLLHVSRGVRWDSDHVVILDDEVRAIAQELVRGGYLDRVHVGLDFFDASINRIAAWVIGARSVLRALLLALLEPHELLYRTEADGDFGARLFLLEELKGLPAGAVWDEHCRRRGAPVGTECLAAINAYEKGVLAGRA